MERKLLWSFSFDHMLVLQVNDLWLIFLFSLQSLLLLILLFWSCSFSFQNSFIIFFLSVVWRFFQEIIFSPATTIKIGKEIIRQWAKEIPFLFFIFSLLFLMYRLLSKEFKGKRRKLTPRDRRPGATTEKRSRGLLATRLQELISSFFPCRISNFLFSFHWFSFQNSIFSYLFYRINGLVFQESFTKLSFLFTFRNYFSFKFLAY